MVAGCSCRSTPLEFTLCCEWTLTLTPLSTPLSIFCLRSLLSSFKPKRRLEAAKGPGPQVRLYRCRGLHRQLGLAKVQVLPRLCYCHQGYPHLLCRFMVNSWGKKSNGLGAFCWAVLLTWHDTFGFHSHLLFFPFSRTAVNLLVSGTWTSNLGVEGGQISFRKLAKPLPSSIHPRANIAVRGTKKTMSKKKDPKGSLSEICCCLSPSLLTLNLACHWNNYVS